MNHYKFAYPLFLLYALSGLQAVAQVSEVNLRRYYLEMYCKSRIDSVVWNGDVNACDAGSISPEIISKAELRINFFRKVNGLEFVKIDDSLSKMAQEAAFVSKVNGVLEHSLSPVANCYSEFAAKSCKYSNMGFTSFKYFPETAFITGFIEDSGPENYFVGHRRWLLSSRLRRIGYGATDRSEAVAIEKKLENSAAVGPPFISYPWNGCNPLNLIYPVWSFSIPKGPDVDFSQTKVEVVGSNGELQDLEMLKERKGFQDPTITWRMTGWFSPREINLGLNSLEERGLVGKIFNVRVSNVILDGVKRNYKYIVHVVETPSCGK